MAKSAVVKARVEPELKIEAEAIFRDLGLSPTEAVTLFYKQVTFEKGLPFEVKVKEPSGKVAENQAHPLERFFGLWSDMTDEEAETLRLIREEPSEYYLFDQSSTDDAE